VKIGPTRQGFIAASARMTLFSRLTYSTSLGNRIHIVWIDAQESINRPSSGSSERHSINPRPLESNDRATRTRFPRQVPLLEFRTVTTWSAIGFTLPTLREHRARRRMSPAANQELDVPDSLASRATIVPLLA
jgi:hypothetical protein